MIRTMSNWGRVTGINLGGKPDEKRFSETEAGKKLMKQLGIRDPRKLDELMRKIGRFLCPKNQSEDVSDEGGKDD